MHFGTDDVSSLYSKDDFNYVAILQLSLIKLLFFDNHHRNSVLRHLSTSFLSWPKWLKVHSYWKDVWKSETYAAGPLEYSCIQLEISCWVSNHCFISKQWQLYILRPYMKSLVTLTWLFLTLGFPRMKSNDKWCWSWLHLMS